MVPWHQLQWHHSVRAHQQSCAKKGRLKIIYLVSWLFAWPFDGQLFQEYSYRKLFKSYVISPRLSR